MKLAKDFEIKYLRNFKYFLDIKVARSRRKSLYLKGSKLFIY